MVELHTGHFANIYAMLNSSLPYSNHSVKELELSREELEKLLQKSILDIKKSAKYAKKLWIDLIITDHHEVQDWKIPDCIAVINPQRQDCEY